MTHIARLIDIMARLRDPNGGCPWDVEQDFSSIAPHTIEEAYEVVDAIDSGDMNAFKEELGDLLLQVVFHSQMAQEQQIFDFEAVAGGISDKLIARHPHVFGDTTIDTADQQETAWEQLKEQERAAKGETHDSAMDGITTGLPGLLRAVKLTKRAAKQGFDWDSITPIFDKLDEEKAELQEAIERNHGSEAMEEELGDMLFVCANIARHLKIDPEKAARSATRKFERRFREMEVLAKDEGTSLKALSLEQMEALWNAVKKQEKEAA